MGCVCGGVAGISSHGWGGVLSHTVVIQDVPGHYLGLEGFAATPEGLS